MFGITEESLSFRFRNRETKFHSEHKSLSLPIAAFTTVTILSSFSVDGRCFLEDCGQFWGLFTPWKACSERKALSTFGCHASLKKRRFWNSWERIRFQISIYIQDGGSFCLLIVDVGLLVVGAWRVAYSLLTYLRPVRVIPFSFITDIFSKIQNGLFFSQRIKNWCDRRSC